MSDGKISLEFLGEQMVRMQSDLRGVRADQARLETDLRADIGAVRADVASVKNDLADVKTELADVRTELTDVRREVGRVDAKIDNLAASVDARFDQVQTTMATNLEIVLKAIDTGRS